MSENTALILSFFALWIAAAARGGRSRDEGIEGYENYLGRSDLTIGIRNNNPGNIRKSGINWQGETACNSAFECFSNMFYGIRALVKNLKSYYFNRGLTTVGEIIYRWAPPSENDSDSYVNYVSGYMGIAPNQPFEWNFRNVSLLTEAIITVENGAGALRLISPQTIRDAIRAAL